MVSLRPGLFALGILHVCLMFSSTYCTPALLTDATTPSDALPKKRLPQDIRFTSRSYRAYMGSFVALTCLFFADGDPACLASPPVGTVGKVGTVNSGFTVQGMTAKSRQFILEIDNVSRSDAGFYECRVTCGEKIWTAETRLRVDVRYGQPTTSWWRADNGSLTVSCAGTGFPRGQLEWLNSTGLTTQDATLTDGLWHLNSTMFIPFPDPQITAYFCVLSVWGSGEFDLGVVNVVDQPTDGPEGEVSGAAVAARQTIPADDEGEEERENLPLIIIVVLACLLLGLLLRCFCAIWPCLCCCRPLSG